LRKTLFSGKKVKEMDMKNRGLIFFIFLMAFGCATPGASAEKVSTITGPQSIPVKEKLYTLSFRKADIREILTVLSRKSELNIIVDPDVKGEVTVDLKEVTITKALDCLLDPLGLEYKKEANFIRVSPVKMQTRRFILNYLITKRAGSGTISGSAGENKGSDREGEGPADIAAFIKVETSDTSDLWKEIEEGLKGISSGKGRLVINKMSGSVIATDFPQNLARMSEFLETIEDSAQRQVMIQANIIEVVLFDEYQMGVDWSAVFNHNDLTGTFTQKLVPDDTKEVFQINFLDIDDFSLLLDAMSTQGKTIVLSSPKISTLNNQPAVIKVATEDVYWERDIVDSTWGGNPWAISSPRWITIGILLKVTPQIGSDGLIIMDIHPSITDKVGESMSPEGDVAPILDVRETNTVVKVRDGQTIIIAGLLQKREEDEVTSVPFLGKIPFLGIFFSRTVQKNKKTELIIMLTPKVVEENHI
jgi:MSHA biogenesis protein MshL